MTTKNGKRTKGEAAAVANPIEAALLGPRSTRGQIACEVRDLRREFQAIRARYAGGLPAELQSRDALLVERGLKTAAPTVTYSSDSAAARRRRHMPRRAIRAAMAKQQGRPIDLIGLLRQRRPNGQPVWSLADPRQPLGRNNGAWYWPDRGVAAAVVYCRKDSHRIYAGPGGPSDNIDLVAPGLPPLPARVRELFADPKLAARCKWMAVLFQPAEWVEVNPDPAVIVEYTDLPGKYFALAIWGGDRARIAEWVD